MTCEWLAALSAGTGGGCVRIQSMAAVRLPPHIIKASSECSRLNPMSISYIERGKERERERKRQTDRQTDRQTYKRGERQSKRGKEEGRDRVKKVREKEKEAKDTHKDFL